MRLPRSVQEIADVIGAWKALRLVRELPPCGKRDRRRNLYIPKPHNLTEDHRLVQLLGWDDAMAMAEALGGDRVQPAPCKYLERAVQNRRIFELQDLAYTNNEISGLLNLSEKWVDMVSDARRLHAQGEPVEVISMAVGINQLTLGYMLGIDVPEPAEPIKRRPRPRPHPPQLNLALGTNASGEEECT